jgi:trafficking protein particle complex subunit 2
MKRNENKKNAANIMSPPRYLRTIDRHQSAHISAFLTGSNTKFLLLSAPDPPSASSTAQQQQQQAAGSSSSRSNRAFQSFNPTSAETEEAIKKFFLDVYDAWVKTVMNPFYQVNAPITSPVFRQRVQQAARKHL